MLYMVIETFAPGRVPEIYRRLERSGRLLPDGLEYVSSWITEDLAHCYQVMRTDDRNLLDQWVANWDGYMTVEIHAVITSAEAARRALS